MLVENDVARRENAMRLWIIAAASLGIVRVAEKNAAIGEPICGGKWRWCLGSSGSQKRADVRSPVLDQTGAGTVWRGCGCARAAIQEVGGGVECVRPERGWHGSVEKHGAHTIIQGVENALGTAILLRCVGGR